MNITPEILEKFEAVASDYFAQSRKEMLPYVPHTAKTILDIGCNKGAFGFLVKQLYGAEVWGVELDYEFSQIAKKQLDTLINRDINTAIKDLPDAKFDCITCNDVLEHLVDPYSILTELKTKLTPQGVIVCSLPNVRYWDNVKSFVFGKQWKYTEHGILDRTHLRFFTELSMRDMFTTLGFEIIQMEGITPTRSDNLKLLNFVTAGAFDDCKYLQFASVIRPR
ncbi:MAG: class I SAM-dependent methyltransferase [bacterium]